MSALIIKEENKCDIECALLEIIRLAIKNGLIHKEDLEKMIYEY